MSGQTQFEYFIFDAQRNQYVPSPKCVFEGPITAYPILMANNRYLPSNPQTAPDPYQTYQTQPQRLLLSTKQPVRQAPAFYDTNSKMIQTTRNPATGFKSQNITVVEQR